MIQTRLALSLLLALPMLANAGPGPAGSSPLTLARVLGGAPAEPAIVGRLVYVPTGRIITAVDYSNFLAPRIAGDTRTQPVGGYIVGLARRGRFLYAAWDTQGGASGVAVYSLPAAGPPHLVAEVDYTDAPFRNAQSIAVAGDRLYLFDSEHGIFVGDLADPATPVFVQGLSASGAWQRIHVDGDRLYAVGRTWSGQSAVEAFAIGTPLAPVPIGFSVLDGLANFRLKLRGQLAYGFGLGLSIHDPSNPAAVVQLSHSDNGEIYFNGVVSGLMAYGIGNTSIGVWEILDPTQPFQFESEPADTFATDVAVPVDGHALLVTRADRILWLDLGLPVRPLVASEVLVAGAVDAYDIGFVGDTALILQNTYGLQVAEGSTLEPLRRVEMDLPPVLQQRAFEEMAIAGGHAYLASWGGGLLVADIADPRQPVQVARLPYTHPSSVDVAGGFAYLGRASDGGGVLVVDVRTPSAPTPRGAVANVSVRQLRVRGDLLYVADGGAAGGLRILDVADPDRPVQVGHYQQDCTTALALAIDGDGPARRGLILCRDGLHVLDLGDPRRPRRIGRYALQVGTAVGAVAIAGNRVYLGSDEGFEVLDMADPGAIRHLARHEVGSAPRMIRIAPDGRVIVLTGSAGLHEFRGDALFTDGFDADSASAPRR
jgi:hypothetical protein